MIKTAHKQAMSVLLVALLVTGATAPARAVDPPYQADMERLSEIMGSLYFLQPLCDPGDVDWRQQAADLIASDQPDEDRRQRLAGAFNSGYTGFARFYRVCTASAREAMSRLLAEAEKLARDMHSRYAE